MISPHFELNPHWRPVQDLHWGICVCLPCSFLLLLATQAQLHRTVDSPWTADEKLRQHILRLLSPQLISKNGVLSFLFKHLVSGGGRERIRQRGGDGKRGEIGSAGEKRDGEMLRARLERGSDWEGGEASELSAGLFWKHTVESLSVNSWLLFLDLLCLPVWPYNIIHLVYRFLGAFSLRDP